MAKKLYEESNIADIAEAIRSADESLQSAKYKTSNMADGVDRAIELSYEKGRKAEYDAFWDVYQDYGKPQPYYYAFAYDRFTDDTYNPKYDIVANSSGSAMQNMFYNNYHITNTKVPIDARNTTHIGGMFYSATKLKTVKKLILNENVNRGGTTTFYGCKSLENIEIEGVIVQSMTFSECPLTVESMNSIISHLKQLPAADPAYVITFKADREDMLTQEEKAIAINKGWTLTWI